MGERRLIEITTEMSKMDGPVGTMGYLTSLKDSDMYLFLKYVKSSRYEGMPLWKALVQFSNDYLSSKEFSQEVNEEFIEIDKLNMNNDLFANNDDSVFTHHSAS